MGEGEGRDGISCAAALARYDEWSLGTHLAAHGAAPVSATVLQLCGTACFAALAARELAPAGALARAAANLRAEFAVVGVSEAMDHFLGMCAARFRALRFTALAHAAVSKRVHSCADSDWCMRRRASCGAVLNGGASEGFLGNASSARAAAARVSATLEQEIVLYERAAAVTLEQWEELKGCRVRSTSVPWSQPPQPDARASGRGGRAQRMAARGGVGY